MQFARRARLVGMRLKMLFHHLGRPVIIRPPFWFLCLFRLYPMAALSRLGYQWLFAEETP